MLVYGTKNLPDFRAELGRIEWRDVLAVQASNSPDPTRDVGGVRRRRAESS